MCLQKLLTVAEKWQRQLITSVRVSNVNNTLGNTVDNNALVTLPARVGISARTLET